MPQVKNALRIEITTWTIAKAILLLMGLFFFWQLRGVAFMLFFAFILYSAFKPVVDKLEQLKIPRKLSILLIYLVLFMIISIIFVVGANAIIDQIDNLSNDFEGIVSSFIETVSKTFPWLENRIDASELTKEILKNNITKGNLVTSNTLTNAFGVLSSVGAVVLAIFVVVMVSVYMLVRKEKFYARLVDYLPSRHRLNIMELMKRIETRLGSWFIGEVFLMFSIGFATWVGISLPGLFFDNYTLGQYALPIALIAGLLEAVPNLGPTMAVFLALIVAVGSGNLSNGDSTVVIVAQSIYVVAFGTLIQSLEALFLVPMVMKKAVGIDPIVTILGIIAALSLFGIVGALLIIPVIATGQIIFEFYQENKKV
jgi:predicted PurR-regulated permease PerM